MTVCESAPGTCSKVLVSSTSYCIAVSTLSTMSSQPGMFFIVPEDVLDNVWSYLHTSDLARVDVVTPISENVWTTAIQRRCGKNWPGGKYGVMRLFVATHGQPCRKIYSCASFIDAGKYTAVLAQSMNGVRVWRNTVQHVDCNIGHANCMSMYGENHIVVGNEYGLMLYPNAIQLWALAGVVSVACLEDQSIWFCTSDQRGYSYKSGAICELGCNVVLCVSGPKGLAGTATGTFPVKSLPMPCCRIVQNNIIACAWFADGNICTIKDQQVMYVFQSGMLTPSDGLSVVGDVVCVGGKVWRDGHLHQDCPYGERVCTADGTQVLVRLPCGGVGPT